MTLSSTVSMRAMHSLLQGVTVIVCLASLLGFAGRWWWLFELASHFRVQYLVLLAAGTLLLLATRHYRLAAVAAACALLNLYVVAPLLAPAAAGGQPAHTVRIVSANVKAENSSHSQLLEFIRASDPDIVTLFEVNSGWQAAAAKLARQYPYSRINAINETRGHFGSALFSKYPIEHTELKRFGRISHYAVIARLSINGEPLHLIGAHVLAPTRSAYFRMRNAHLQALADTARQLPGAVMLIGDLNTSSWSPYFRDLQQSAGLRDGRPGFGIQASWPVGAPLLRIPIDHCLVSPGMAIRNWTRGPDIGSDHFPILIDFSLPAPAANTPEHRHGSPA